MKKVYLLIKAGGLALLPYLLHASVTLGPGGTPHVVLPPLGDLTPLLNDLPALATTLLTWYELAARLVPTARNISLLSGLIHVLERLVPNRALITAPAA